MDQLVERAKAGDLQALEALLEKIAPSIHRFGLRMCRNESDADDILQDSLLGVSAHLKDYEGRSSLLSWVFAIAKSACIRKRRGLKNQPTDELAAHPEQRDPSPSPEEAFAKGELSLLLARALEALPEEYREVIILRDIEGLSAAEAAHALDMTEAALKSRLHRGRQALREQLAPVLEKESMGVRPAGCPQVELLFSKMLEGELSRQDCENMQEHIKSCRACDSACHALKTALSACQASKTQTIDPHVRSQVTMAVESLKRSRTISS